jgi:hypothetical protein
MVSSDVWDCLRQFLAGTDELARKPVEGRIIEALYKPIGVVAGPSDMSFHRDSHLGRVSRTGSGPAVGRRVGCAANDGCRSARTNTEAIPGGDLGAA